MREWFKGYWKYFILIISGALVALIGGLIGKKILGWVLFGLGLAAVIALLVLGFLRKQIVESKWKTALLLCTTVVLIAAGSIIMLTSSVSNGQGGRGNPPQMPNGANPPSETAQFVAVTETATATEEPATATPTPVPAVATPTATAVSSLTVCLNENTNVGYNIRVAPRDDAAFGGKLDMAACFVVDGRSSQYPDWYKMAPGQNGGVGISIGVDDSTTQLWVKGYYIESFGNDLNSLPEVTVQ